MTKGKEEGKKVIFKLSEEKLEKEEKIRVINVCNEIIEKELKELKEKKRNIREELRGLKKRIKERGENG